MEGEDHTAALGRLEDLIEENIKLSQETNRIVRDMRRTGRVAFWFKVILWVLVLGLPLFFLGPIIRYMETATGISIPANSSLFGIPSADDIQKAITQYKAQNSQPK